MSHALEDILFPKLRYAAYRLRYRGAAAEPYKILWIDPEEITARIHPKFRMSHSLHGYHILDGDWDLPNGEVPSEREPATFENWTLYQSMKSHFEDGVAWEDTAFYEKVMREIPNSSRYGSEEKIRTRFREVDDLYERIAREGYKTQREIKLDQSNPRSAYRPEWNEIRINIGRRGALFFEDGRHRFAIARILGIDRIPVRVLVRHKRWQKRRVELANLSAERLERLDADLKHPDVQDVLPDSLRSPDQCSDPSAYPSDNT